MGDSCDEIEGEEGGRVSPKGGENEVKSSSARDRSSTGLNGDD
jgi:hypothetical protein